jgi:uncharacterized membrane protein
VDDHRRADRLAHQFFLLTILAKGSLGLVQLATAAALFLGVTDRLPQILQRVFRAELAQDPTDFVASRLMALANLVPGTDLTFYTVYFLAHGLLHVGVVVALLIGAGWAYPGAVIVLAGFVIYQLFEWLTVGGPMLLVLSAIDILVIGLTLHEWAMRRRGGARVG